MFWYLHFMILGDLCSRLNLILKHHFVWDNNWLPCRLPDWRDGWMDWWMDGWMDWRTDDVECSLDTGWREILTTACKQMGAITNIRPFSSVCSILVNICVDGGGKETKTGPMLQPETLQMENEDASLSNGFTTIALNAEGTLKLRWVVLVCWSQSISVNKCVIMHLHRRRLDLSPIQRHCLLLNEKLILAESDQDEMSEFILKLQHEIVYQKTSLEPPPASATPLDHPRLINQEERLRSRNFLLW